MARVLIVDDTAFFRVVLRELLEGEGHEVFEARDGREGVARFRQDAPDLVITDLSLPEMAGGEVVAAIREVSPAARVLVLSGSLAPGSRKLLPPDVPFLTKPFTADHLLSVVGGLLGP